MFDAAHHGFFMPARKQIINISFLVSDLLLTDFDATATDGSSGDGIEDIDLNGGSLIGSTGNDSYNFSGVFNFLELGTDQLALSAGAGDDVIVGTQILSTFRNEAGTLLNTDDISYDLGAGDDTFIGATVGSIDDTVDGGAGDDVINGGNGTDTLIGGAGADTLDGGAGNDVFLVNSNSGDNSDVDIFIGGTGADVIVNNTGGDLLLTDFDATATDGSSGDGIEDIDLNGGSLIGSTGNDSYDFSGGFNFLELDTDQLALSAGAGDDVVLGTSVLSTFRNEAGPLLNTDDISYDLGAGDDIFTGAIIGSVDDTVDGGSGNDVIDGGTGTDTLIGGVGNDILTGGAGADTFIFNDSFGDDIITDFNQSGSDIIDFSDVANIEDFADLLANHAVQDGANVVISDGVDSLTLENVDLANLDASDFIF